MIFAQSDLKESQTIEALVPMVDLFAVLAIVFMIYASDEIKITELTTAAKMQEVVETIERESEERIQAIVEQYESDPQIVLAKEADQTIEEVKERRRQKAEELVLAFTAMLEAQQEQAADEYEDLAVSIEQKHEEALSKELVSLDEQKQVEIEIVRQELRAAVEVEKSQLEKEQEEAVERVRLESAQALAEQESELEIEKMIALADQESILESQKEAALAQAEVEHIQELIQIEAVLEEEKRRELEKAAQAKEIELARHEAALRKQSQEEKRQELERAAQAEREALAEQEAILAAKKAEELRQAKAEHARQLAQAEAESEAEKQQALEQAAQAETDALAEQEAILAAQKAEELRQAKAEHARQLAQAEAESEAEKQQALEQAAQAEQEALDQLQTSLAADKEKALEESEQAFARELDLQKELTAKAEKELTPFLKAAEAKQQIVDLLNENFKDYDASAVEIDEKTGKVRLNFQESYFVRGSHELSQDMKDFLRIMIPKYARSIYENENAAELVESLKISGITSPIYKGKYIDINDTSPRSETARQYNMDLSNRRAVAMYNFIFDESEMGNYKYRTRLKKDMGIAALGFQHAQPVRQDLVGKTADCLEYNCKKEQATILQFQLYTEELGSF